MSQAEGLTGLIDSHCHLDMIPAWRREEPPSDDELALEQAAIVARARAAGVCQMVVPGCSWAEFPQVREVARRFSETWLAFGIHPHDADTWQEGSEARLAAELAHDRAVGVGECGLDYHYDLSPRDRQREAFVAQIRLARSVKKPLIVHTREAETDTARIMREERASEVGGVLHCFTGSLDLAHQALEMGFYVSFSGVLTFAGSGALREVARQLPLDRILVETDSPYLAPVPHRGKRNEPALVAEVVRVLAGIHGRDSQEVGILTADNARTLFGLAVPGSDP